ncbi:hypothetical protein [Zhaonella formicivorans]|uniref:hypothetical protein n=1 Tax=Zhaonella formicivorans TaxID=2528593 RepID=UPI0010F0122C|nr:hypothetical protein [Zhaonella formicivorans]
MGIDNEQHEKSNNERIVDELNLVQEATKQPVLNETQVGLFNSGYVESYEEALTMLDGREALGKEKVKEETIKTR